MLDFPIYEDDSEAWFRNVVENHYEEARSRALSLLEDTTRNPTTGCMETPTIAVRKVRFRGRQVAAYRFIHCVLSREVASRDVVVRHRCHHRRCINPEHLELGTQADNKRDDWERWAGGVDYDWL